MQAARLSRVDRLKENDGGGVNLHLLFSNLLSTVQQDKMITVETARESIKISHNNQFNMMRTHFRDYEGDGISTYLLAALELLESQDRLKRNDDSNVWVAGPKLVTDKPMRIMMNAHNHWTTVKLSSAPAPIETFDSAVVMVRSDIHALVRLLEPHMPGLREVTEEGKEALKKSLAEHGLMPGYPILKDHTDRILSGRHRMAVEEELKQNGEWDESWPEAWPVQTIHIENGLQALGIAMAGNRATPFTEDDYQRLGTLGLGSTKMERQRRLIELALLENANRSNRTIAKLMPGNCSHNTVEGIRRVLEASGQIDHWEFKGGGVPGQGITTGKLTAPRPHIGPEINEVRAEQMLREGQRRSAIHVALGFSKKANNSRVNAVLDRIEGRLEQERQRQDTATAKDTLSPLTVTEDTPLSPSASQTVLHQPLHQEQKDPIIDAIEAHARALRDALEQHPEYKARVLAILGLDSIEVVQVNA